MRCKVCKESFKPVRFLQKDCGKLECKQNLKRLKVKDKKPKVKSGIKTKKKLQTLLKEFEKVFNAYIRKRDNGKPCISCGQYNELQAGHYFAVSGYKALRFDEDNVHGEGACCNMFNESHLILYGINLKKKIGERDYNDLLRRAENYKAGKYQNEYYKNGKWDREGIEKGIEYYSNLLKD